MMPRKNGGASAVDRGVRLADITLTPTRAVIACRFTDRLGSTEIVLEFKTAPDSLRVTGARPRLDQEFVYPR
jgi:hypothetical protein